MAQAPPPRAPPRTGRTLAMKFRSHSPGLTSRITYPLQYISAGGVHGARGTGGGVGGWHMLQRQPPRENSDRRAHRPPTSNALHGVRQLPELGAVGGNDLMGVEGRGGTSDKQKCALERASQLQHQ